MKRTLQGMAITFVALAGIVWAQSGGPAGSSLGLSTATGNNCGAPVAGTTLLCGTTTGVQESHNGSAYTDLKGKDGAPGPAGPAGATGPAGPAGPPGAMPAGFSCSTMTVNGTGVTFTGCK